MSARLLDGPLSAGLATLHAVAQCSGFDQELGKLIRQKGGPERAVRALRNEFFGYASEIERPLGENEYLVHVDYDMPRDRATLESEFSKDGVSELFYGDYEWQPHSSCAEIDQTPGNRVMLLKQFGDFTNSEANIAKMNKLGYRPATHFEAYAFAKTNPELQRQFWIVALGSSTVYDGYRHVAVLRSVSARRILGGRWCYLGWRSGDRFLFVGK